MVKRKASDLSSKSEDNSNDNIVKNNKTNSTGITESDDKTKKTKSKRNRMTLSCSMCRKRKTKVSFGKKILFM